MYSLTNPRPSYTYSSYPKKVGIYQHYFPVDHQGFVSRNDCDKYISSSREILRILRDSSSGKRPTEEWIQQLLDMARKEEDEEEEMEEVGKSSTSETGKGLDPAGAEAAKTAAGSSGKGKIHLKGQKQRQQQKQKQKSQKTQDKEKSPKNRVKRSGSITIKRKQTATKGKGGKAGGGKAREAGGHGTDDEDDEEDGDNDLDEASIDDNDVNTLLEKELNSHMRELATHPPRPTITPTVSPLADEVTGPTPHEVTGQYHEQEELAKKIREKMITQLAARGKSIADFDNFAFYIQLPALNSIYNQTLARVQKFVERVQKTKSNFFPDLAVGSVIYKAGEIKKTPKMLFLIVHDEAHWHATKGGVADRCINDKDLLHRDNSQVPPDNEIQWHSSNSSYYGLAKYVEEMDGGPGGIKKDGAFESSAKWFFRKFKDVNGSDAKKRTAARALALIKVYSFALQAAAKQGSSSAMLNANRSDEDDEDEDDGDENTAMINDLVNQQATTEGRGIMILLRVPPASGSHRVGNMVAKKLRQVRQKCGCDERFAIILDLDAQNKPLVDAIEPFYLDYLRRLRGILVHETRTNGRGILAERDVDVAKIKHGEAKRCSKAQLQRLQIGHRFEKDDAVEVDFKGQGNYYPAKVTQCYEQDKYDVEYDDIQITQYSDLEGLPCILVLCEKGKMGGAYTA
eukprot:g1463.t1